MQQPPLVQVEQLVSADRDRRYLPDGLDEEAVLGWVREVIEVDLLGDQPG